MVLAKVCFSNGKGYIKILQRFVVVAFLVIQITDVIVEWGYF